MAGSLYLEIPAREKPPMGGMLVRRLRLVAFLTVLFVLLAVGWWWLDGGRAVSAWAMLDGMVYAVSPEFSARLEALDVREGDMVSAGQPVARMDAGGYARRLNEAGRAAASLRPPDMPEMAERIRQAQEMEKDLVTRLAQARHEEEAKRRQREERVTEHVRAQLNLRSLDSQGGERAADKSRYASAQRAETEARARMESAKADFEQVSRMRAAMEQELGRISDEVLRAKQLASRNRYTTPVSARASAPLPVQADGILYAPVNGRILRGSVTPGQNVQSGEPVLLILPEGADAAQAYWVRAYFFLADGEAIKAGQACDIRIRPDGARLKGMVAEVLAPQPLPDGQARAAVRDTQQAEEAEVRGAALFLPVKITLDGPPSAGLAPGEPVDCVVKTRNILGFSGF
ncbi:HlyD family efflux transporter periplasmic adaptor subunit [uncultured Desulfovibrio sp.]|uniref:HlyD family secretion protein n=1 Tax=uncultured Desulfovibrio sp. TaxID=167968 RepID=UPI002606D3F6|nr:HlyD family efflux transporter periplasmic adaptor subunit [uncultured Desulfovibrio sp.]